MLTSSCCIIFLVRDVRNSYRLQSSGSSLPCRSHVFSSSGVVASLCLVHARCTPVVFFQRPLPLACCIVR